MMERLRPEMRKSYLNKTPKSNSRGARRELTKEQLPWIPLKKKTVNTVTGRARSSTLCCAKVWTMCSASRHAESRDHRCAARHPAIVHPDAPRAGRGFMAYGFARAGIAAGVVTATEGRG